MLFADDTEVEEYLALRDVRNKKDFAGVTFEGHRLNAVKKAMLRSMKEGHEEETMNWMIEMLFSNHESDIWDVLCKYYGRYLRSEKALIYLTRRRIRYEEKTRDKTDLRNDAEMRYIYMEMCMVLMEKEKYDRTRPSTKKKHMNTEEYIDTSYPYDKSPGYDAFATASLPPRLSSYIHKLKDAVERGNERESKEMVEEILRENEDIDQMEKILHMTEEEQLIQRISKEPHIYYEMIERRIKGAPNDERLLLHTEKLKIMEQRINDLYCDKKRKEVVRKKTF
jgi:hypothetical protein